MDDKHLSARPKPPWRRDDHISSDTPAPTASPLEASRAKQEADKISIRDLVKDLRSSLRNDARKREAEQNC